MNKPIQSYRQAILVVLINTEGKFFLGSSPRDGGYKMPQGGKEEGEASDQTLIRELKEELDIDLGAENDVKFLGKVSYNYPEDDTYFIYIGQEFDVFQVRLSSSQICIPQDDEFGDVHWIDGHELELFDTKFRESAYKLAIELSDLAWP